MDSIVGLSSGLKYQYLFLRYNSQESVLRPYDQPRGHNIPHSNTNAGKPSSKPGSNQAPGPNAGKHDPKPSRATPLTCITTTMIDPMAGVDPTAPAGAEMDASGDGNQEVFDTNAYRSNMRKMDKIRSFMGIVSGCVAGVCGLTGISGLGAFLSFVHLYDLCPPVSTFCSFSIKLLNLLQ